MHLLPLVADADAARRVMQTMHLDVLWLVTLLAVGLIAAGFGALGKANVRHEQRLSLMTDALPLAVAYIDADERYRFVNARYARLHAHTPEVMIGAKVADVVRPDLYERFRDHNARALRGEAHAYEHRARLDLDGEMHDLHIDLVPEVLEGRVAGFFLLVLDVTSRVQLEREVVRATEVERLSVARDLHDGLGQALTGISLALGALARKLDQEGSKQVHVVSSLTATAQKTIEQARQFTHLLAPTMQGGLFAALRTLAREVSTLYDVECFTRCPPEEIEIPPPAAMHLYRIAQESVNNAARHGRASAIRIDCRLDDEALVLRVADDGLGIPMHDERRDGLGLKSMYYRARMIGGALNIAALAHGGTEVSCRVLLSSLAQDAGTHAGGEPATDGTRRTLGGVP
jgi:PAS domain S-box-containing protein